MTKVFNHLIAIIRFILMLVVTIISAIWCWVGMPFLSLRTRGKIIRFWAKVTLAVTGVKVKIIGRTNFNYFPPNMLVASNHLSWLDILVLYQVYFINFVGKVEMTRWPILSRMIKAGGTIFINRKKKRDLLYVNQAVSEHLLNGRCIGFFPEGTVGDGDKLLPFKAPILESALIAKSSIIPVVIIYYRKDGTIAEEASFGKKYNLVQSVLNTLTLNGLIAKIFVLETVKAENFANRDQLTEHLYQQINAKFSNRQILFDEN